MISEQVSLNFKKEMYIVVKKKKKEIENIPLVAFLSFPNLFSVEYFLACGLITIVYYEWRSNVQVCERLEKQVLAAAYG